MPSDWASLPALTRWKSGVGWSRSLAGSAEMRRRDDRVRLVAERQAVLRLGGPGLALGVVERPLVERDDRLPRLLDDLLAELDGLGQDDLFLGGQQGDLADLLEVHPDRVVDADHVGADRLELLGGRLLDLLRVELGRGLRPAAWRPSRSCRPRRTTSTDSTSAARRARRRRPPDQVEVLVVVVVVVDRRSADGGRGRATGAGRRAWPPRGRPWRGAVATRTASTSCLSSGSAGIGSSFGSRRQAARGRGRPGEQSGVWSRRRSSDRRAVVELAAFERSSRSIASASPARSASAERRFVVVAALADCGRPRGRGAGGRPRAASGAGFGPRPCTAWASARTLVVERPSTSAATGRTAGGRRGRPVRAGARSPGTARARAC